MARFPTSTDCLCVWLKEARKLGFVVHIAGTMRFILEFISKPKSGWSHLYCVTDSIMHTVPFNSSNMISSVILKFKRLQEAEMVLKQSFSTDIATDKFYFP